MSALATHHQLTPNFWAIPTSQSERKGGISEARKPALPDYLSRLQRPFTDRDFGFWTDEWPREKSFVRYPSIIDKVDECGRLAGELQSPKLTSKTCPDDPRARRAANQSR
jgi:hypothetical protein